MIEIVLVALAYLGGVRADVPAVPMVAPVIAEAVEFDFRCNSCDSFGACNPSQHVIIGFPNPNAWPTTDAPEDCHWGWCVGNHDYCGGPADDALEVAILSDDAAKVVALAVGHPYGVVVNSEEGVLQVRDCSGRIAGQYHVANPILKRIAAAIDR